MASAETPAITAENVNDDDIPLAQAEVGGVEYRADAGLGSAVAISHRETGTWSWSFVAQGRWDGRRLRAKGFEPEVLTQLAEGLTAAMRDREGAG